METEDGPIEADLGGVHLRAALYHHMARCVASSAIWTATRSLETMDSLAVAMRDYSRVLILYGASYGTDARDEAHRVVCALHDAPEQLAKIILVGLPLLEGEDPNT